MLWCANAHGFLKTDPGAQFTTPRLKVVLPVLPPFEVMEAALAAEPRLRNRAILVIGLYGGLRAEEIVNLRRANFVSDAGLLGFVGKGGKQRSVALPQDRCSARKTAQTGLSRTSRALAQLFEPPRTKILRPIYDKKLKNF